MHNINFIMTRLSKLLALNYIFKRYYPGGVGPCGTGKVTLFRLAGRGHRQGHVLNQRHYRYPNQPMPPFNALGGTLRGLHLHEDQMLRHARPNGYDSMIYTSIAQRYPSYPNAALQSLQKQKMLEVKLEVELAKPILYLPPSPAFQSYALSGLKNIPIEYFKWTCEYRNMYKKFYFIIFYNIFLCFYSGI